MKINIYFSLTGICTTTDVDPLLSHMNNARYLRELDFARADFYERTNLYREICSQGSGVVQGAATIRYRRFLKPFTIFKITSKVCESGHVKSYYGFTFVRCTLTDRHRNPYKKFSRFFCKENHGRLFPITEINLLTLFFSSRRCFRTVPRVLSLLVHNCIYLVL